MSISHTIEEISQRIEQAMPESLREGKQEFEKAVRQAVSNGFSRMDLVTREEFDVQTQVLARTRAKLEALEQRVSNLEKQLEGKHSPPPEPEEGDIAS
ncbi:accessory factor UbiK family protein [Guyparkeria hydrothermalis]|uniref:ubiquinone biosynthesis accessory factor UbiK n=1 Tax=Guyparkeria hydrothermalis TaxID=923 RepID=UPI0020212057|nr:accessory factor UbiK family protein [Guyparkeria hydrothermalis]MCL7744950.1 accessory factor UbiK family protein [Guyparkeria hydrothermalis]